MANKQSKIKKGNQTEKRNIETEKYINRQTDQPTSWKDKQETNKHKGTNR